MYITHVEIENMKFLFLTELENSRLNSSFKFPKLSSPNNPRISCHIIILTE